MNTMFVILKKWFDLKCCILLFGFIHFFLINVVYTQEYCNPVFNSCSYNRIFSVVTVNATQNINNISGDACAPAPYYTNFTDQIAKVKIGEPFSFTVQCYYSNPNVKVWIDWNDDLVFSDDELLFSSSGSSWGHTHSTIHTVTNTAFIGTHRVRVRSSYNTLNFDACSQGQYGETEDYTIEVLPPPSCLPVKDLSVVEYPNNSSVKVAWASQNGESSWTVIWGVQGFTPGDANEVGSAVVNSTEYTIENLILDKDYDVYVRANCSVDDSSVAAFPIPVKVECPQGDAGKISGTQTICEETSVTLSSNGLSGGKWISSNENVATVGENTGVVIGISTGTANITYQLGENVCTKISAPYKITVNEKPSISLVNPIETSICKGETVNVQLKGVSSSDFSWSHSLGKGNTKNLKPDETTTYTVTGKKNGCYDTMYITITVHPKPTIIISGIPPSNFCEGDTLTLTASGATNYTWLNHFDDNIGSENPKIVAPKVLPGDNSSSSKKYKVIGTDANGCSNSKSIYTSLKRKPHFDNLKTEYCQNETPLPSVLPTQSQNGWNWYHGTWTPSTVNTSIAGTTTYTWVPNESNGCSYKVKKEITVKLPIELEFDAITFCKGTVAPELPSEFNNGISGTWSPSTIDNQSNKNYTFTPSSGQCATSFQLSVMVMEHTEETEALILCENQIPYIWNGQSLTVTGTYTHTEVDPNGCNNVTTLELTVNKLQIDTVYNVLCEYDFPFEWNGQMITEAGEYTHISQSNLIALNCDKILVLIVSLDTDCQNEHIYVEEKINICENETPYLWNNYSIMISGNYSYSTTNAQGTDSTITLIVTISPVSYVTVDTVMYENEMPIIWFGDTIDERGLYTHKQLNISSNGCDSITIYRLFVNKNEGGTQIQDSIENKIYDSEIFVYIPNSFTPNGGNLNETFFPVITSSIEIESYIFEIYDRWGERIFATTEPNIGWDGTYIWKLVILTHENAKIIKQNGHVNLLR